MIDKLLFALKRSIPRKIFIFFQPFYHFSLSFLAAVFYGFPSRKLRVIGVTGTKGKTTVVELLHKILQDSGAGVASVSSLRFKINDREEPNDLKMTMPGRFFVQKFLRKAVKSGCRYAILEVTSEGIKQFRQRFIRFDIAAMTNVSPEHIESHGSFENYLRAKLDLFWRLSVNGRAVINSDDEHAARFSAAASARKIFYGKSGIITGDKKYKISDLEISSSGIYFEINGHEVNSSLLGEFNFYNILAAASVCIAEHISLERIAGSTLSVKGIPGRLEFLQKEPFAVVVDYAHTPDSLRGIYSFLNSYKLQATSHKLICVLGAAGGGRDKWKRPEMGKIAGEFCDEIILTNEDPYDENPEEICEQISSGFSQIPNPKSQIPNKILDRREAIREALGLAKPGDTVVITGKGAEQWIMGLNGQKIEWDDRKVVREELKKLRHLNKIK